MRTILWAVVIVLFGGCSIKVPLNRWQYQSNAAYKNFERYYLENRTDLAAIELERARSYASQSGDLTTLGRIELSKCALQTALLEPFSCKAYEEISSMTHDDEMDAYYALLSGHITAMSIPALPKQYRNIALLKKSPNMLNNAINEIAPLTSRMIAASLFSENLDESTIETIIADASHLGYKHAVIVWMTFLLDRTQDTKKKNILSKKLNLLLK